MRKKIKENPKRINKKAILAVVAVVAIVGGIAAFSSYEAHVINVTAHIENALTVDTTPIEFGTVFPQEYLEEEFTINLSSSFLAEDRVDDVEYVINQKPKPIWPQTIDCAESIQHSFQDIYEAREYCHDNSQNLNCCYLTLCPFLSKTDGDPEDNNDIEEPSYYDPKTDTCPIRQLMPASGRLAESEQDISDIWIVDLKVPPVRGYVGQDWPAGCPVVDEDSKDYGCDLWIEVTDISETNNENNNHLEPYCGDGIINGNEQCEYDADCSTGMVCNNCQCEIENNSACASGDTRPCYTGDLATRNEGLCQDGTQTCVGGFWEACVGDITPVAEVCDGEDNNCDGITDEGNPGGGGNCNTGLDGICTAGTLSCQGGSLTCVQNNSPQAEVCNGLDDNCDGVVDEALTQSCSLQLGVCEGIIQTCTSGSWSTCDYGPYYEAGTELTCDDLDNDCDDEVDEGDVCVNNDWTYEQDFNALSDGDLNGQDSWSGYAGFDVQTTTRYEGTKAVEISGAELDVSLLRGISSISSGSVYVALRSGATNQEQSFILYESGVGNKMVVSLNSDGNITILNNTTPVTVYSNYSADIWYVAVIEFDDGAEANKYRVRIHDGVSWGSWSSWVSVVGGSYTSINWIKVNFHTGVVQTDSFYFDIITPSDPI